ncbi:unnamed protein product [Bemisia tabaci]|uniref:ABC transporter domain-containing protein n=1 Tax=Bemisia tabaci TaxID=7038 RepID=A0AAI8UUQ5_BEMTA|nr:PREDICTED: ATP-binding cassette sub-family G member 1-like isoform X2 [Bemisia tabaci]CAH0746902.1 unnamed protein product [Bemisia tabaci]
MSKVTKVLSPNKGKQQDLPLKRTVQKRGPTSDAANRFSDISFSDLSYSVKTGLNPLNRGTKQLLNSINGEFKNGQVTAIIGPSGAGKTSLLNILTGFTTEGVDGKVLIDGKDKNDTLFAKQSCYIMQDNHLQPLLTVQESMTFAATLKLGRRSSPKRKIRKNSIGCETFFVDSVLDSMNLISHRHTLAGTLSGGERKKLSIALELINNPPFMFFDEPTSGLDSTSAKQCLSILKQLASGGRTIICTLHQPSASHLNLIDNLYCLANGECVYQGSPGNLIPFLSSIGFECPTYHNPVDFLIELASGALGYHVDALVKHISNGKNQEWKKDKETIPSGSNDTPQSVIPLEFDNADFSYQHTYGCSVLTQFRVLLWRDIIKIYRDSFLTNTRLTLHFLVALLLGIFYYGIGQDAAHTLDNFSLLFFSVLFLMFTSLQSKLITFPEEMPIVSREHFNGWYSLEAYFITNSISDAPIQILSVLIYSITVFVMSSQPLELYRFLLFFTMLSTVTLLTQAVGVLVGILLDVKNGVIFGPLTCLPWVIFSGFFLRAKDAPSYFSWLFEISFMKYALEGVMSAIYGYNRPVLDCSEMYCHFRMPKKLLHDLGLKDGHYLRDYSFILALFLGVKFATYFVLRFQTSRKL